MAGAKRRQREGFPATDLPIAALIPLAKDVHVLHGCVRQLIPASEIEVRADDVPLAGPVMVSTVEDCGGGIRLVVAARIPVAQPCRLEVRLKSGIGLMQAFVAADTPAADVAVLIEQIRPARRPRVVRQLIETVGAWFRLFDDPEFVRLCRRLVLLLCPAPSRMKRVIGLGARVSYCRGHVDGLSEAATESVLLIGPAAIRRNPFRPSVARVTGRGAEIDLVVERPDVLGRGPAWLAFFTSEGVAAAAIESAEAAAALIPFLESQHAGAAATRAYLLECLKPYAAGDPQIEAVAREAMALLPTAPRKAAVASRPLAAEIECAIPAPNGGLFVKGWLVDPFRLVDEIVAVSPFGTRRSLGYPRHRQHRPDLDLSVVKAPHAVQDDRPGFVAYADGFGDPVFAGPYRFALRLLSGATVDLIAPPPPLGYDRGRDAVLDSLPIHQASDEVVVECVVPAVGSLHRAHLQGRRVRRRFSLGNPCRRPVWSIIVPLYRNLDFLRFQLAALAVDPDAARCEIILVLDSPDEADMFEQLLRELHFTYQLPVTAIVHDRNLGYAPAINSGAEAASGEWLVLLNSDVVPMAPGWLSLLAVRERRGRDVGAVGPKLLFEDESLQHAGLYFDRDLTGRWLNRHFHKGYPRGYAPANMARRVPAVTGACLLLERGLFARVGGMSEDYVIGDYEDSDLCLRLDEMGRRCWYEPAAELYHFERQSIMKHAGYSETLACDYNRLLHSQRWGAAMDEIMRRHRHASFRAARLSPRRTPDASRSASRKDVAAIVPLGARGGG